MYIVIIYIFSTYFIVKLCTDGVTIVDTTNKKSEELLLLSTLIASDFKYRLRS